MLATSAETSIPFPPTRLAGRSRRRCLPTAARGEVFHGRPAREGIDAIVARLVGGGEAREAAIVPIAIRGRIVQLLYVDNGPEPLSPSSLAALGALCDEVAAAYDRLVGESTREHC
jgi:hypothetical protein